MSILSPHETVTPGAGDKLGRAGVGLGSGDEDGAFDIPGTGDELLRVNGLDAADEAPSTRVLLEHEKLSFITLHIRETMQTYG